MIWDAKWLNMGSIKKEVDLSKKLVFMILVLVINGDFEDIMDILYIAGREEDQLHVWSSINFIDLQSENFLPDRRQSLWLSVRSHSIVHQLERRTLSI